MRSSARTGQRGASPRNVQQENAFWANLEFTFGGLWSSWIAVSTFVLLTLLCHCICVSIRRNSIKYLLANLPINAPHVFGSSALMLKNKTLILWLVVTQLVQLPQCRQLEFVFTVFMRLLSSGSDVGSVAVLFKTVWFVAVCSLAIRLNFLTYLRSRANLTFWKFGCALRTLANIFSALHRWNGHFVEIFRPEVFNCVFFKRKKVE